MFFSPGVWGGVSREFRVMTAPVHATTADRAAATVGTRIGVDTHAHPLLLLGSILPTFASNLCLFASG